MAYIKSFPVRSDKSIYPKWEDIVLTAEEEKNADLACREENKKIMSQSIDDAKEILEKKGLKGYETSLASIAQGLFDKRASHVVYWKEEVAREKFEKKE